MQKMWLLYEVKIDIEASTMSFREMVSMSKEEVVEAMTRYILEMNRKMAIDQNIPSAQLEPALEQMLPQLTTVNGELYDLLVDMGVIE